MQTGKNKLEDTRKFVSMYGYPIARFNNTDFDGTNIIKRFDNPWLVDEPLTGGSDGIMNQPFL